jgi:hypothetical protein
MTTGTAAGSLWPAHPARRQGPVVRTAASLLGWFGQIALWYWGFVLVVAIGVPFIVDAVAEVELSILWFSRQSGIWFPFSILIAIAGTYPVVHVAQGMTRRSYVRGALVAAVVLAAAFAVLMTLGLLVERAWYGAMGWRWRLEDGWFTPDESLGRVLVAYLATFTVAYLSGLLVGTVYAAHGGWWGTLTLPLTVGPVIAVIALVDGTTGWIPFAGTLGAGPGEPVPSLLVVAAAAVLALALAAAFHVIATRRPVPPRRG